MPDSLFLVAVTFSSATSVLLVAVMVIFLFCGALLRFEIAGLIAALFVDCMCSLIGGLAYFLWDVNLSLRALWLDFPGDHQVGVLDFSAAIA